MRFREKVVWITGASSGIGEALAYRVHDEGGLLTLSARREEELERVAARCRSREPMVLPLDVTSENDVAEATARVFERFGRIDILINNAGLTHRGPVVDTDQAVFRRVMDVNFFGPLLLTKAVLPSMIRRKSGHIVVVTSIAAKYSSSNRAGYNAAKHAAHGLFNALREEVVEHGIGVTLVAPGPVRTSISINALTTDGSRHGKMDAFLERGLAPETCASHILDAVHAGDDEVVIMAASRRRNVLYENLPSRRLYQYIHGCPPRSSVSRRLRT